MTLQLYSFPSSFSIQYDAATVSGKGVRSSFVYLLFDALLVRVGDARSRFVSSIFFFWYIALFYFLIFILIIYCCYCFYYVFGKLYIFFLFFRRLEFWVTFSTFFYKMDSGIRAHFFILYCFTLFHTVHSLYCYHLSRYTEK